MKRKKTDIERFFRSHYEKMYHLAKTILYDDAESRDAVSEVFAQLLREPITLLPESEEGYLLRSVRNRCLNVIAHKSVRERAVRLLLAEGEPLTVEEDSELLDRVMVAINALQPPLRRQILHLRHLQGLSYKEIAEATGVSRVTVYHHLSQAMDSLRNHFKQAEQ